jgi:hypothetical protein
MTMLEDGCTIRYLLVLSFPILLVLLAYNRDFDARLRVRFVLHLSIN